MEEFKKLCAGMAGAIDMTEQIDSLMFTDNKNQQFEGYDCLQAMATNIEFLNDKE